MATAAEVQAQIDKLDTEIATAIESVSVDGTSTKVSLSTKQSERTRLRRKLRAINGGRCGHGLARPINLGGF